VKNLLLSSSRKRESSTCSSVLGTNPADVVPAQAETHNHQGFGYRWLCHIALLRRMGPRLREDDAERTVNGVAYTSGRL
jgi:hypothetical protein